MPPPALDDQEDRLEFLLADYERRKQDETRTQVRRALELEQTRREGADLLRRFALAHTREVSERLRDAGHVVVYEEMLDAYPPSVRLHLWPKMGPLDAGDAKRSSLEFVWGDPYAGKLAAKRWTSEGLDRLQVEGAVSADSLDSLWVREALLAFVRESLGRA